VISFLIRDHWSDVIPALAEFTTSGQRVQCGNQIGVAVQLVGKLLNTLDHFIVKLFF